MRRRKSLGVIVPLLIGIAYFTLVERKVRGFDFVPPVHEA